MTPCRFVVALVLALPAHAYGQEMMALRPDIQISGDVVRLGDLVEHAGERSATPLFRAPDLGGIGTIRAERILAAARDLGLSDLDLRGVSSVTIRRPARTAAPDDLVPILREALAAQEPAASEAAIQLDPPVQPLMLEAAAPSGMKAEILSYDAANERFEARITAGRPDAAIRVTGRLELSLPVPVPNRPIARGEAIQPGDLVVEKRKRRAVQAGTLTEQAAITGLVTRRALRPGVTIREADLVRPTLVDKNQLVTVIYEAPGIALTLRGKALSAGAEHQVVSVQNLNTKRTLDAVVIGPGRVSARLATAPAN